MISSVVYCIDSSALIDLRRLYRPATLPDVWADMSRLASGARLLAPRQVWKEIKKRDDELCAWAQEKTNRVMFIRLRREGVRVAAGIMGKFPGLVDDQKETEDADPFVIALAMTKGAEQQDMFHPRTYVVLTSEASHPQGKPRIPDVCKNLGVECMYGQRALADMFEREGWRYVRRADSPD